MVRIYKHTHIHTHIYIIIYILFVQTWNARINPFRLIMLFYHKLAFFNAFKKLNGAAQRSAQCAMHNDKTKKTNETKIIPIIYFQLR